MVLTVPLTGETRGLIGRAELPFLLGNLREERRHRLGGGQYGDPLRGHRGGLAALEYQPGVADRDLVPVAKPKLADPSAVHEGAVGRAQVAQDEGVAHPLDGRVFLGNLAVDKPYIVGWVTPERHLDRCPHGELGELTVGEFEGEPGAADGGGDLRREQIGSGPRAQAVSAAGTLHRHWDRQRRPAARAHRWHCAQATRAPAAKE